MRRWGAVVLLLMLLTPEVAHASTATRYFNPANLDQGIWSKLSPDFSMPADSNGDIYGDVSGCASGKPVYGRLRRHRSLQPDENITNMTMYSCTAYATHWYASWSSGSFHFDASIGSTSHPSASGWFQTLW